MNKKDGLVATITKLKGANAFSIRRGKKLHWFQWNYKNKKWEKYREVGYSDAPREVTIKIYKKLPRYIRAKGRRKK